jgi:hypothetical protein
MSTREEEGQGSGDHSTRPADHVVRLASHHLVSYYLGQVSGALPRPYEYPPPAEIRTHTPHFRNSTWKALILSVVARRSLFGRVVGL